MDLWGFLCGSLIDPTMHALQPLLDRETEAGSPWTGGEPVLRSRGSVEVVSDLIPSFYVEDYFG